MFLYGTDLSPEDKVLDTYGNYIEDFMVLLHTAVIKNEYRGRTTLRELNTLSFMCLNPGYGFKQLQAQKPRSIILTSGTL